MSRWKVCDSDGDGDGDIGQSDEGLIAEHRLSVHAFCLKTGNGRRSGYTGPRGGGNSPTRFTALKLTHYLISPAASFSPPGKALAGPTKRTQSLTLYWCSNPCLREDDAYIGWY
ncbi:hypothetical protein AFLA_012484 [Aspergillus flavus NRRL3357]|nr:hypothetical protein AFLA_012484 [Aspergillus flavus NRRL3357]